MGCVAKGRDRAVTPRTPHHHCLKPPSLIKWVRVHLKKKNKGGGVILICIQVTSGISIYCDYGLGKLLSMIDCVSLLG